MTAKDLPNSDEPPKRGGWSMQVKQLMEATTLPDFMNALLSAQAVTIAGTEAAGFMIDPGENDAINLRVIGHLRPDNCSDETRTAALDAFLELVRPCVEQAKDGAIEVRGPNDAGESQFCLVTLLHSESVVVAATAVIVRCSDLERARNRLFSMQMVAGFFELFQLQRAAEKNQEIINGYHREKAKQWWKFW